MKKLLFVFFALLLFSCSQLLEVVREPQEVDTSEVKQLLTKSDPALFLSKEDVLHYIQSDHITMLVNGVMLIDSIYVQALSDKDMSDLHISDSEKEFSCQYVEMLNADIKHRKELFLLVEE